MVGLPDGSLYQRAEKLIVNYEFGIVIATGQPSETSARKAFLTVQHIHTLTEDQFDLLRADAESFSDKRSGISIDVSPEKNAVYLYDELTRTNTSVPLSDFSRDVQKRYPAKKIEKKFDSLKL